MDERRLPGETEAVWDRVRDGEVWTYRAWASLYLLEKMQAFPGAQQVVRLEREVVHKATGEVQRTWTIPTPRRGVAGQEPVHQGEPRFDQPES